MDAGRSETLLRVDFGEQPRSMSSSINLEGHIIGLAVGEEEEQYTFHLYGTKLN